MKRFHVHIAVADLDTTDTATTYGEDAELITQSKSACFVPEMESIPVQIGKKCT